MLLIEKMDEAANVHSNIEKFKTVIRRIQVDYSTHKDDIVKFENEGRINTYVNMES